MKDFEVSGYVIVSVKVRAKSMKQAVQKYNEARCRENIDWIKRRMVICSIGEPGSVEDSEGNFVDLGFAGCEKELEQYE